MNRFNVGVQGRAFLMVTCLAASGCYVSDGADHDGGGAMDAVADRDAGPLETAHYVLEDTTGLRFCISCTGDRCRGVLCPGHAHPMDCGERTPTIVIGLGRVLLIAAGCDNSGGGAVSRPVVCRSDADCDLSAQTEADAGVPEGYQCMPNGICEAPEKELRHTEVMAMCLAAEPRPESFESRRDEGWSAANQLAAAACADSTCEIPDECAWPGA